MLSGDLAGLLTFLRHAERLKHMWRRGLMALVVAPHYPEVDTERLLKMCLVHDLGEALQGDIPAPEQVGAAYTAGDPLTERLRAILDAETAQHARSPS